MNKKVKQYVIVGMLSALVLSGCSASEQIKDFVDSYLQANKDSNENEADNNEINNGEANNDSENKSESKDDSQNVSNEGTVENENQENPPVEEKVEVATVDFEHDFISSEDGGMDECAVVSGMDAEGNVVWKYETGKYEVAQLDRITDIGQKNDMYYFVEDNSVVALNVSDGSVLWKNAEFCGSGTAFAFGEDGILYMCGYFGPDFFAVDTSGKTLHRVESFDANYIWPYKLEYQEGEVLITFESSPVGDFVVGRVNLEDYTIQLPE